MFLNKVNNIMQYLFPLSMVVIFVLYYFIDPVQSKFPLQCPWRLLTGTYCPACGFQRALYALVHGKIIEALSYNLFFLFSIPYALLAIAASWYNYGHSLDKIYALVYHRYTLKVYVVLYCAWWVIRNLYDI